MKNSDKKLRRTTRKCDDDNNRIKSENKTQRANDTNKPTNHNEIFIVKNLYYLSVRPSIRRFLPENNKEDKNEDRKKVKSV